jgi:uncharacterized repeat protein (TIGR03809 family)
MAQRVDATRAQEILDRWCALAEQRLEHLTELFETGRWRRYHSELSFLENIQEAKKAVETWRSLARREASLDNSAIDISWLNSPKPLPPRRNPLSGYYVPPPPRRAEVRVLPQFVEAPIAPLDVTPTPAIDDNWQQALDIGAIQERYPLLRNAL